MKWFVGILIAILLCGMLAVALDGCRARSLAVRAKSLKDGDSKEAVRNLLGKPDHIFFPPKEMPTNPLAFLFIVSRETWAYGSRLKPQTNFPYVVPFRLRLFGPDADEVAVKFDSSNRVAEVTIPTNAP
ncbi:MAG: hypothetical protein HY301_03075 [Verrucomicrobia bacterium]|nr:hypothetical protein [Verrucomicrobiota bacterium]